jgi:hypothetical protein
MRIMWVPYSIHYTAKGDVPSWANNSALARLSYTSRQSELFLLIRKENVPNSRQTPNTGNDAYLVLQPLGAGTGRKVSLDLRKTPESGFVGNLWSAQLF